MQNDSEKPLDLNKVCSCGEVMTAVHKKNTHKNRKREWTLQCWYCPPCKVYDPAIHRERLIQPEWCNEN